MHAGIRENCVSITHQFLHFGLSKLQLLERAGEPMNTASTCVEFFDPDQVFGPAERYSLMLKLTKQAVLAGYVRNDWLTVLDIVERLTQLGELDTTSRLLRSKANMEIGQFNEALAELIELSNSDPWCATTQNLLGEVRLLKKKYKDAVRAFSSAISVKSVSSLVTSETVSYVGRAMAFTFLGRWPAVVSDMNTCSELADLKKARMHYWAGRHIQCALHLESLPDRVKALPSAQYLRVQNIIASGRCDKALLEFPKLLSANYTGLSFLYLRSVCNFQTEDYQVCVTDLTKIVNLSKRIVVLELNPITREVDLVDICQILKMRAACYTNLRQYPAAIEDYERIIYWAPSSEIYLSRAQIFFNLGLFARSLADIGKAEETLSDNSQLKSLKVLCLSRLSQQSSALAHTKSFGVPAPTFGDEGSTAVYSS